MRSQHPILARPGKSFCICKIFLSSLRWRSHNKSNSSVMTRICLTRPGTMVSARPGLFYRNTRERKFAKCVSRTTDFQSV